MLGRQCQRKGEVMSGGANLRHETRMFIDGKLVEAQSGKTFENINQPLKS